MHENSSFKNHRHIPEFYWIERMEESKCILLRDNNSYFISKERLIELVTGLNNAIENYDKFELDEFNEKLKEHHQQQIQELNSSSSKKLPRKILEGYIYFITYDKKYYKIGKAKNLKNRMKVFSVEMPGEIEIFHTIHSKDIYETELLFHEYFKSKRTKGEWFELTDKDLDYIKSGKYTKEIKVSIKGGKTNE